MTMRYLAIAIAAASLTACEDKGLIARADTLETRLTEQQALANQLAEQKDSLTRVVLDADAFLGQMDSAINTVRGLPRARRTSGDPLADQLQARKDMQARVAALVTRAKQTASQLAELQKKQAQSDEKLAEQANKIEEDAQLIADLGATIDRQNTQIALLEARLDSLTSAVRSLGERHYKAYVVIGTERELMAKGVAVKEGGANLLVARPGRTLQPARVLNPDAFTSIDQRETTVIQVPDSTKRYRLISRQSLDAAEVTARDGQSFIGNLRITKPDEFWAGSRFLILVQQ
jgi:hypothetical protein